MQSLHWYNKNASKQPPALKSHMGVWQGQNTAMHAFINDMMRYDSTIRNAAMGIFQALETAPCLPKGAVVWRVNPLDMDDLMEDPEKWMSVSATKEGAMHFANGRAMRICEIEIGDDNIQGLPVKGDDSILDAEQEIIIRPGFNVEIICAGSNATIFRITKA